jgi:predicted site-specific integrase-resolvase
MAKARNKGRASNGAKRVAIYLRVSTSEQTTANQRRELQVVAKRHGWSVVQVFEDAGISAPSVATNGRRWTRCSRPLPAGRLIWSPHGRSIAWAAR